MNKSFPKSLFRLLVILALLSLMVGAVSAQDKHVIRIAAAGEPPVLIDYVSASGAAWAFSRIHSHEAWGLDNESNLIPLLVDEVPSVENGGFVHTDDGKTVVTFHISDGAKWSDGEPIVAADFQFVYDIMNDGVTNRDPARFAANAPVSSIEQGETDKDVIVTIDAPVADVASTAIMPLPAHILREPYEAGLAEGKGFDTLDYVRNPTVTSGPFSLGEWVSGSYLRFVKNPFYAKEIWADEYLVSIYPDVSVIEQVMANNEADYTTALSDPLAAAEFVAENPNLEITTAFTGTRLELHINNGEGAFPALRDVRVRQALRLGIDRQGMVDGLFDGLVEVANSYWTGTPWYDSNLTPVGYDPEAADALLTEAGWYDEDGDGVRESHGVEGVDDGTAMKLRGYSYSDGWAGPYSAVALVVQDNLKDLGIDVDMTLMLWSAIAAPFDEGGIRTTGNYDLIIGGRGTGTASVNQTAWWACSEQASADLPSGTNYQYYCNPEMDTLWTSLGASLDDAERQDAANQIQEIMDRDVPSVFLVTLPSVAVKSKALQNVEASPGGNTLYYNLNEWEVVPS
jgi:peptide/nickel transport system substrate-binding protein